VKEERLNYRKREKGRKKMESVELVICYTFFLNFLKILMSVLNGQEFWVSDTILHFTVGDIEAEIG
jgi:hypothetical protein